MNKINKSYLLAIIVIAQALYFVYWYFSENSKLKDPTAKNIMVEVLPYDPRDLISGNYLNLNYKFNSKWGFKEKNDIGYSEEIYAVLTQEGKFFVPDYYTDSKPKIRKDQVILKAKYVSYRFEYGIEKYFITEGKKEPLRTDKIEAELVVDEEGNVRIKQIFVNDEEF